MREENDLKIVFDAMLEVAGKKSADMMGEAYPAPAPHAFSKEHEQKMRKLFRKEKNKLILKQCSKYAKRAAMFIFVFLLASAITIFSVQALRIRFLNFVLEVSKIDTIISFTDDNLQGDFYSDDEISLDYIPEGMRLQTHDSRGNQIYLVFNNGDKYFSFTVYNKLSGKLSLDTENAAVKKTTLNGMEALYSTNANVNILVWHDDERMYDITGTIEEKEIMKIAENMKFLE